MASALILGSMPGQESLRKQEYYANSKNSFWYIMGCLIGADPEMKYADRVSTLKKHRIALWDVFKVCAREDSLDSSIIDETAEPNDFLTFYDNHPHLTHVFFNGIKAETAYKRSVIAQLPEKYRILKYRRLPSTSSAYAAMSVDEKLKYWRIIIESINNRET